MLILKVIFVSLWEPCFKVFRRNRSGRIQLSLWPLDVSGGSLGPDLGFRLACPPPLRQSSPWACPAHLCSLSPELSTEKVPSKCLMNGSDMLCSFLSKYWAISRQGPCCLLPVGILRLKEWMTAVLLPQPISGSRKYTARALSTMSFPKGWWGRYFCRLYPAFRPALKSQSLCMWLCKVSNFPELTPFVLVCFSATPRDTQDLSSLTRDWTHAPCHGSMKF